MAQLLLSAAFVVGVIGMLLVILGGLLVTVDDLRGGALIAGDDPVPDAAAPPGSA